MLKNLQDLYFVKNKRRSVMGQGLLLVKTKSKTKKTNRANKLPGREALVRNNGLCAQIDRVDSVKFF